MDVYSIVINLALFLLLAALGCNCEGSVSCENDYEALKTLCITIIILFISWLIVLAVIFLFYWRYVFRTQPNRIAVSLEPHLGDTEMEEWGSIPGAVTVLSIKEPILKKNNRSTQTEPLLIESLVTPERPLHYLPPIRPKEHKSTPGSIMKIAKHQ